MSGESDKRLMKYIMDADVTESEDSDRESEGQVPSTSSAYLPFRYLYTHICLRVFFLIELKQSVQELIILCVFR